MKTKKTTPSKQKSSNKNVAITATHTLYDWTELLTYDQIVSTLSIIEAFATKSITLSKADENKLSNWLKNNDLQKFVSAAEKAEEHFLKQKFNLEYAKDIMSYSYKYPRSH